MPPWLRRIAIGVGLALGGAVLFGLYAVRPRLGFVPYLALVPWTILYTDPKRGRVSWIYFAAAAYVTWVIDYKTVFQWGWFAPLVMAAFFTPTWLPFPFLMRAVQRLGLPRAVTLPIVWVAVEWFRVAASVGHFDIFLLGYSQVRFIRLAQMADLFGVYGVSFLVAAVNGLLADGFFVLRDGGWRRSALAADRRLVRSAAILFAMLVLAVGYGVARLATVPAEPGPRLAVIQPNVGHTVRNFLGVSLAELDQTDAGVAAGSADLIVWPENAVLDDLDRKGAYLEDLKLLVEKKHAWLLLGAQGHPEGRPDRTTNSAFLVDDGGRVSGRYDKQILYPWSEYVPIDAFLGAVSPPAQRFHRALIRKAWGHVSTGMSGVRMILFQLPWDGRTIPFAALICVENSYPPLVAEAGRMGARFFVNITSEGQLGGAIQEQLLRVCMMRAIENRIAYVRCGNSGISGFIDPDGRLRSLLTDGRGGTISVAGTLTDTVRLSRGGPTVYALSHDAFAWACVAGALGLALAGITRRRPSHALPLALAAVAIGITGGCSGVGALDTVCRDEASCRSALPQLAETFRQRDAAERAVAAFGAIIEKFPALAGEARAYRAFFRDRSGDLRGAIEDCEASLGEAPNARTWSLLGSLRARIGDPGAAVDAFEQARRLAPDDDNVKFLLARSRWESGDDAGARRMLDTLLPTAPRNASGLTLLAKLDLAEGREDDARAALEAAAAADPAHLECRYYLARLAWRHGRKEEFDRWLAELRDNEAKVGRTRDSD